MLKIDYVIIGALAAIAVAISPYGVRVLSGRLDLSLRTSLLSSILDIFLILIIGAMLTRGRLRRGFFWLIALVFPLAIMSGLEAFAQVVGLANVVAPLTDNSVFRSRARYPSYFKSDIRSITQEQDGVRLYRPWHGKNITINRLGLRTALPKPKRPGEWRVAITGGSTAWGYNVLDADTIAVQVERILQRRGHGNIIVYNFGIGGREIRHELALLKNFRNIYALDQVIFYTGGNDVVYSYMRQFSPDENSFQVATWELVKTARRLHARLFHTSISILDQLDSSIIPKLRKENPLRAGILAADDYCHRSGLRCSFILQPMLATRRMVSGKELEMQRTLLNLYPRLDKAAIQMYADAMALNPSHDVQDFSDVFDHTAEHFYADAIHVNEAGNRLIAKQLAAKIVFGDLHSGSGR